MGDEYGREVVKVGIDRVCARFGDFPHQHADDVEGERPPKRIIAGIGSQARELLADATLDYIRHLASTSRSVAVACDRSRANAGDVFTALRTMHPSPRFVSDLVRKSKSAGWDCPFDLQLPRYPVCRRGRFGEPDATLASSGGPRPVTLPGFLPALPVAAPRGAEAAAERGAAAEEEARVQRLRKTARQHRETAQAVISRASDAEGGGPSIAQLSAIRRARDLADEMPEAAAEVKRRRTAGVPVKVTSGEVGALRQKRKQQNVKADAARAKQDLSLLGLEEEEQ